MAFSFKEVIRRTENEKYRGVPNLVALLKAALLILFAKHLFIVPANSWKNDFASNLKSEDLHDQVAAVCVSAFCAALGR